jgi:putative hydrolase of the HAD superfamily
VEHEDPRLTAEFKILAFDLGGVLLRLNPPARTFGLPLTESEFLQRWIHSESVRQFEKGAIDPATFADRVIAEIELPYDAKEFLERFDSWPDDLYDGILDLLDEIPSRFSRALLSNTNAIHWQRDGIASALEHRFDKLFLSYVTGRLKPDADAFLYAQEAFSCAPGEIVFFDDNPTNVAAAARFGCQAFLTRGIDELRSTLKTLGAAN